MTNVLNNIITNQPMKPAKQALPPSFTFDSEGKIKPLEDKAKLLPSRIFGSPIEYVKDLKQDVVNIGRAAKGKANDHELGRINDVAMKLGSLGLATYLCIKNPLKLSKTMEFVGVGTFFTSMALWPKLAIQAPLKARTGVDIHQKYIDSQGRKKMLHQDPQYDLTDLYSREDLDKMGKKLNVAENLPDRDSFIKKRAKKTALQGNTLWMMTAGLAAPTASALACNVLEKPITNVIETFDLKSSQKALETGKQGLIDRIKQSRADKAFSKFLEKNAGEVLDANMAKKLSAKMGSRLNAASMQSTLEKELIEISKSLTFNDFTENFVATALKGKIDDTLIASLSSQQKAQLENALANKSFKSVSAVLANAVSANGGGNVNKLRMGYEKALNSAKKVAEQELVSKNGTVGAFSEKIKTLYSSIGGLTKDKQIIDKYVNARVGEKSGTYVANQWTRVTKKLLKTLKFSDKELKLLSENNNILTDKLSALAANDKEYNKAVNKIMSLIQDYEGTAGEKFVETVQNGTVNMTTAANQAINGKGFNELAKRFTCNTNRILGNFNNEIAGNLANEKNFASIAGELFGNEYKTALEDLIRQNNLKSDKYPLEMLKKTADYCKQIKEGAFDDKLTQIVKNIEEKLRLEGRSLGDFNNQSAAEVVKNTVNGIKGQCGGFNLNAQTRAYTANSGTLKNLVDLEAKNRMQGAQSSFYRILQTLDVFKRAQNGSLKTQLEDALITNGGTSDPETIKKLTKACKDVVLDATTTDHIENLLSKNFKLSRAEYKAVMEVLYGQNACSAVENALGGATTAKPLLKGFRQYTDDFVGAIANWTNEINPEASGHLYGDIRLNSNPIQRNNLVGNPFRKTIADTAKQTYNSHKWLKIFGGTMAILTAVTLIAGLAIGRKGKMEKQAEEESKKING